MEGSPSRRPGRLIVWGLAVVAVFGLAVAAVWWSLGKVHRVEPEIRLERRNIEVAPGVYMLGSLSPSAVYVVRTSMGLALVDSGLAADAAPLRAAMAELGLDWKAIKLVLLTHAHGDHTGGAEWLRRNAGARIAAGSGDTEVIRAGKPREAIFSAYDMPDQTHPTQVDLELRDRDRISLGDTEIEALAMPGHTPGSTCYLLNRDGLKILFAGDVIMMLKGDDHPRDELGKPLGTYSAYLPPRYRGDAEGWFHTLMRMLQMPAPDLVLPGHPRADNEPQSPRFTSERWQALAHAGEHDMSILRSRHAKDGPDFLDGTPKTLLPDLDYLGDFAGRSVYVFQLGGRYMLIDAPGKTGLSAFIREGLKKLGRPDSPIKTVLLTSCDDAATAGLAELGTPGPITIVAPEECLERLQTQSPGGSKLASTAEFARSSALPIQPIALKGRGESPCAYVIEWTDKRVLCSGAFLAQIDQQEGEDLSRALGGSRARMGDFFGSIKLLHPIKPELWLPARPVHGQNANLYDQEWQRILEDNLRVVANLLSSSRPGSKKL